ncbi:thiol-disulfide oxidoreductase DCC family protein [Niabella beijingensis]|uniref:thiol-disulfide oxidoreductase DCC family protein n=1 Tax=Niabella beijingensis TaxID=2872700 RepID=UPI001CBD6565|nr:thiol-disulfide oxidoreductase DCC family protein [Niabella beijingensis]MBZ4188319.1 thiol-disulfide oxidoreductase DCC family protein [Niabella beijingensis]
MQTNHPVILFDGVCNLCNNTVQFVIRHDKKDRFRFAALQSPAGQQLLQEYALPHSFESFVLLQNNRAYRRSAAALKVVQQLGGLWPLLAFGWVIPAFLRDRIYDFIARNRYKWFGRSGHCMIPTPQLQARFL